MLDMMNATDTGDRNESRGTRKVSHPATAGVNHDARWQVRASPTRSRE